MNYFLKLLSIIFLINAIWFSDSALAANNCRVLIVVGMEDERAIAEGDDTQVVVGTANATVLRERLSKIDVSRISAVFSFGVAGGLDQSLKPGDLLVSTQVISQVVISGSALAEESWAADQNLLMAIMLRASMQPALRLRKGIFLGTDLEARENPETGNQNLRQITGADIIDNESHVAAKFAHENDLPFVSVRAVSDSVNNRLPPAALIALEADGSPDGSAIAKSILMNPLQIPALIRTAREYGKALDAMRNYRELIGFTGLVGKSVCQ